MKIIKTADYNEMSRKAANLIGAQVIYETKLYFGLGNRIFSELELTKN